MPRTQFGEWISLVFMVSFHGVAVILMLFPAHARLATVFFIPGFFAMIINSFRVGKEIFFGKYRRREDEEQVPWFPFALLAIAFLGMFACFVVDAAFWMSLIFALIGLAAIAVQFIVAMKKSS